MKRAADKWPATPVVPFETWVGLVRARKTFTCEGVLFKKGDIFNRRSELVQAILAEHPELFEPKGGG
jgi:hypothetical protein